MAAQFQDIAVTSAMGMSPLQIALQQGTQLSSVLGPMGAAGAVKGLAAAFTSLLSPVSLVTMGLVAGTSALIQYFTSAEEGTKKVDALLKQHAENIQALEGAYGIAAEGLKNLAVEGRDTIAANAKETLDQTLSVVVDAARDKVHEALSLPASDFAGNINVIDRFRDAIEQLKNSTAAGKPDLLAYRDAMSEIATSTDAWTSQKKLANDLRSIDEEALKAAKSLPSMMETAAVSAGKAASNVEGLFLRVKKLADLNAADISQANRPNNTTEDLIKDITGRSSDLLKTAAHNRIEDF
ncbi:phage tail length tape measure family protein, partial [Rhizobium phaseoli]